MRDWKAEWPNRINAQYQGTASKCRQQSRCRCTSCCRFRHWSFLQCRPCKSLEKAWRWTKKSQPSCCFRKLKVSRKLYPILKGQSKSNQLRCHLQRQSLKLCKFAFRVFLPKQESHFILSLLLVCNRSPLKVTKTNWGSRMSMRSSYISPRQTNILLRQMSR